MAEGMDDPELLQAAGRRLGERLRAALIGTA